MHPWTLVGRCLAPACTLVLLTASFCRSAESDQPPNIVFIFADDQCYETLHHFGNEQIETPNLDRLARSGLTFTHAYNMGSWTGAVCVASRTMLNTGRFLWNANRIHNAWKKDQPADRLWAQHLKRANYDTYFSGKWHLRADPERVFDFVTHVRGGMPNQTPQGYDRPHEGQPDPWSPWDPQFGGFWEGGRHWSEVLGDDSVTFIRQAADRDRPFFMYLAFNAPHDPRQAPKEYVDKYPQEKMELPENFLPEYPYKDGIGCSARLRDEKLAPFPRTPYAVRVNRQEYYAIITHMDAQIGRILAALDKLNQADRTYIFFTADHGLAVGHHGFMGKQNLYDHSVRVPLMVVGPDIPRGATNDTRVYLQDIMPTTLELASVTKPGHVKFKSLLPLIRGEAKDHHDAIYGAYLKVQRMVTWNNHKLLLYPEIGQKRLYNLREDPQEMHDLAAQPQAKPLMQKLFTKLLELQAETEDELDLKAVYPELM